MLILIITITYASMITILAVAQFLHIRAQDKEIARMKKLNKIEIDFFESTFNQPNP